MKARAITIRHSIFIDRPREVVFDFTQDYAKRAVWDKGVHHAEVIQTLPHRLIRLKLRDGSKVTLQYKMENRPDRTSLSAIDFESTIFVSGGGAWTYADQHGGTVWTQVNSLGLKPNGMRWILAPILRWILKWQMVSGMRRVKLILESDK